MDDAGGGQRRQIFTYVDAAVSFAFSYSPYETIYIVIGLHQHSFTGRFWSKLQTRQFTLTQCVTEIGSRWFSLCSKVIDVAAHIFSKQIHQEFVFETILILFLTGLELSGTHFRWVMRYNYCLKHSDLQSEAYLRNPLVRIRRPSIWEHYFCPHLRPIVPQRT